MGQLRVEVRSHTSGWKHTATFRPTDPPGSLSHDHEGQREIIMFSCHGNYSIVEQADGGIDVKEGIARTIYTIGRTELAPLRPGEQFERIVIQKNVAIHVRWTHLNL